METVLLRKKDGQDYKVVETYKQQEIEKAKELFTAFIRNGLASDSQFVYLDEDSKDEFSRGVDYAGPGYYRVSGFGTDELLDNEVIESWLEDVYTYKINVIEED